jgi:hypothetical protein
MKTVKRWHAYFSDTNTFLHLFLAKAGSIHIFLSTNTSNNTVLVITSDPAHAGRNVTHLNNIKMKKLKVIFVSVMLCGSLAITTPLLAQQNDPNTTTTQTTDRNDDDDDNAGLWGLAGLLGLLGLAGLKRRYDDDRNTNRDRVTRNPRVGEASGING